MTTESIPNDLLDRLGHRDPSERWAAYGELEALPEAHAARLAIEALSHPNWYVRRAAAIYADHHPDPALLERLKLALHDPKAKVRVFAVHSLSSEPCKPGGNPVDAVPFIIRAMKQDPAPRVRRMAAIMLMLGAPQTRVARAFRSVLQRETDPKVRQWASLGLARCEEARLAGTRQEGPRA